MMMRMARIIMMMLKMIDDDDTLLSQFGNLKNVKIEYKKKYINSENEAFTLAKKKN